MKDHEWLESPEPVKMLDAVVGRPSCDIRKLRLLACACLRTEWGRLTDRRSRNAVLAAEDFADGLINRQVLTDNCHWATAAYLPSVLASTDASWALAATQVSTGYWESQPRLGVTNVIEYALRRAKVGNAAALYSGLVRDVFPFTGQNLAAGEGWKIPEVVGLANEAYDSFDRGSGRLDSALLSVLADRLQDAGYPDVEDCVYCGGRGHLVCHKCSNEGCSPHGVAVNGPCVAGDSCEPCAGVGRVDSAMVSHLRRGECHVRGCWVVDFLSGRS